MFEVFTEKVEGKLKTRSLPLGVLSLDFETNLERRKIAARNKAEAHVGRVASNVSHAIDGDFVVTFRKAG